MQSLIKKNKSLRQNFSSQEKDKLICRILTKNKILTPELQGWIKALAPLSAVCADGGNKPKKGEPKPSAKNLLRSANISKIRNLCVLTGRPRAVFLDNRVSRLKLKELAEAGLIPGVKKK